MDVCRVWRLEILGPSRPRRAGRERRCLRVPATPCLVGAVHQGTCLIALHVGVHCLRVQVPAPIHYITSAYRRYQTVPHLHEYCTRPRRRTTDGRQPCLRATRTDPPGSAATKSAERSSLHVPTYPSTAGWPTCGRRDECQPRIAQKTHSATFEESATRHVALACMR